tara:strand:+ start:365 stop:535 length:171 start_codon:yes stop_codon:yes gene_type:complete
MLPTAAKIGRENTVAEPATNFDYNNDGLLDIFIAYFGNYIEGKKNQKGIPKKLFKI